ncbi:MAG: enoyl-CoA hydratase/isomerase family protein [Proteobacteria bacterium]|nr:enoyl-CoA hydratase/isomerase family protein [Pseudomonadota bacterium]MBU1388451.1 enoyl-CoA hydratase/isomerase family protein [Pseudomonadota bacterium]MBU1542725.1 enoyl-CoA hydratase/isomerase family protein [Pseudomonadota bacterium]MBU2430135.1 enoyl-CoA hydratase/isomerase family protein [Pseudomonadota bacterium]MBU2481259.1 enoyl-CoA hydratase/isomerase family protein [Pseudomonadota bacterium]
MNYEFIDLQINNHIATVSLNRTKSLNAINREFAKEITMMFRELDVMDDVWVIILKSNARIFCAGLDLKEMTLSDHKDMARLFKIPAEDFYIFECCHAIDDCRKPVICAVHSQCVGFGLDIAAACDMVLCTQDASFSLREARIGIVADVGGLQRLPYIIGLANTKHMAYTGRFFSAQEVERMGLIVQICPDMDALLSAADTLAAEITKSAPLAVQNTKEVLNYGRTATIREGINMAVHKNMLLLTSQDCKESFVAFLEKRKPEFKGQ